MRCLQYGNHLGGGVSMCLVAPSSDLGYTEMERERGQRKETGREKRKESMSAACTHRREAARCPVSCAF
ncbi:hypothetical protein Q8A67_012910 [Cirrhinus molitorella]|uniref:Uncharacterized protein n=1 Tax=Cirrhinus molitorella TaxID=172907 RepID=A0AA88TMV5_9TELE|nr:hypothetical protein Q8A67_012910 [Cirrhinus molitorella]